MESAEPKMKPESNDVNNYMTETEKQQEEMMEQNLSNDSQLEAEIQQQDTAEQDLSIDSGIETGIQGERTMDQNLSNDFELASEDEQGETAELDPGKDFSAEAEDNYQSLERNMSNGAGAEMDVLSDESMDQNMSNIRAAPKRKASGLKKKKHSKKSGKKMKMSKEDKESREEMFDEDSPQMMIEKPFISPLKDVDYEEMLQAKLRRTPKPAPVLSKKISGEGKLPSHLRWHHTACTEFAKTLKNLRTEFWTRLCKALDDAPGGSFETHVGQNILKFFLMYSAQINVLEDSLVVSKQRYIKEGLTIYKKELGKTASDLIEDIKLTHELFHHAVSTGKLELTAEGSGQKKTYDFSRVQFYCQMVHDVYTLLRKFYNFAVAGDSNAMRGLHSMMGAMRVSALAHLHLKDRSKAIHVA